MILYDFNTKLDSHSNFFHRIHFNNKRAIFTLLFIQHFFRNGQSRIQKVTISLTKSIVIIGQFYSSLFFGTMDNLDSECTITYVLVKLDGSIFLVD